MSPLVDTSTTIIEFLMVHSLWLSYVLGWDPAILAPPDLALATSPLSVVPKEKFFLGCISCSIGASNSFKEVVATYPASPLASSILSS